jgi:hypothetical protein
VSGEKERRGEWRQRSWVPRMRTAVSPHALLHGIRGRRVEDGLAFLFYFYVFTLSLHLSFP